MYSLWQRAVWRSGQASARRVLFSPFLVVFVHPVIDHGLGARKAYKSLLVEPFVTQTAGAVGRM